MNFLLMLDPTVLAEIERVFIGLMFSVMSALLTASLGYGVTWLRKHVSAKRLTVAMQVVRIAVTAAESAGAAYGLDPKAKFAYAVKAAQNIAEQRGLTITDDEIEAFIESAHHQLVIAQEEITRPAIDSPIDTPPPPPVTNNSPLAAAGAVQVIEDTKAAMHATAVTLPPLPDTPVAATPNEVGPSPAVVDGALSAAPLTPVASPPLMAPTPDNPPHYDVTDARAVERADDEGMVPVASFPAAVEGLGPRMHQGESGAA